eukprot:3330236-Pleurochrysis_carterae.AAC.1
MRLLMLGWICFKPGDDTCTPQEHYTVEGNGPVCAEFCKATYGFTNGGWTTLSQASREGTLQAD